MRVLLTGHNGYIGSVMSRMLRDAGHQVVGLDTYLYEECTFGPEVPDLESLRLDLRDAQRSQLQGFDAVIHLAALCNDPLGSMNPDLTHEINHRASVRLAELARGARVPRFLFASSCSLYGVAGSGMLQEDAPFNPLTPYAISKVRAEQDVSRLANDAFSPTYLRNATAYGVSPRLRLDVVVNNLVAAAYTTGDVLIQSDGTPWRPLVHVEDFGRAFLAVLHAPREVIHNQAFNVGRTRENYRVSELAEIVREIVPDSRISYAAGGGPDPRSYCVDCSKLESTLAEYRPQWTVRRGVEELAAAFEQERFTAGDFQGHRYLRIRNIQRLQAEGRLNDDLRWRTETSVLQAAAH